MNILFRPILLLLFVAAMSLSPASALAAAGGPDGGGYTFIDSDEAIGGPTYAFEDISLNPANSLNMTGDDKAVLVPIGFDFKYYGTLYSSVYVGSNGHLDFRPGYGNANFNLNNLAVPQASSLVATADNGWGVNPLIAVFFDDLDPLFDGEVYAATLGTGPDRRFVVQWEGIPHYDCLTTLVDKTNAVTFQAILYESGNKILFQYKDVVTGNLDALCQAITDGASATVGLDFDDRVGLGYSANTASLHDGLAVLFSPGPDPAISPSATSLDFGDVLISTKASVLLTLSNPGGSVLAIEDTTAALTAPFEILSDNCTGANVLPGDFCTMSVVFSPQGAGSYTDSLVINSTAIGMSQLTIPISGNGAAAISGGDIRITDPTLPDYDLQADFGNRAIFTGADLAFTVHNDGDGALFINAVEPPASPFSLTSDGCTWTSLAPAETCQVSVHFVVPVAGVYHSTFNIISDDPDESSLSMYINASAYTAAVANITISDSSLPAADHALLFINTPLGSTAVGTVTVGNNGTAALDIQTIAVSANPPYSEELTGTCTDGGALTPGTTLEPGQLCTIDVGFSPASRADCVAGTLSISTNDPDESPIVVALSCVNNLHPPSAPGLVYPSDGANNLPTTLGFKWDRSFDPDPGDTVTYRLYYVEEGVYAVSGFKSTTPIGPIAKASATGADMYVQAAAMGAPCLFVMAAFALSGGISRRRRALLLLLIALSVVLALVACGSGLEDDPTSQVTYSVSDLKSGTTYYWKVTAVDSYGLSTDSAVWSFTTAP